MKHLKLLFITGLVTAVAGNTVNAKNLTEATDALCQKVKVCGQQQLERQQLPPEMAKMMEGMFDGMCQAIVAPYVVSTKDAGLESKAVACLESVNSLSCDELMEGESNQSEECDEFENAADKAYPDGYPSN